jgi:nucleoside-diphosphate-sugar epimerase
MSQTIFVAGHLGLVGSAIVRHLLELDPEAGGHLARMWDAYPNPCPDEQTQSRLRTEALRNK